MTDQYVEPASGAGYRQRIIACHAKHRRGNRVNGKRMMMLAASDYGSFVTTFGDAAMAYALK
jgi:hypothetical protein